MIRELLGWDEALHRALKQRAKRNFRTIRAEIAAILAEVLAEEAEQIRRELEAERQEREQEVSVP